jgi:hypothetical protein
MAKKKMKEKTREEKQAELEQEKRDAWENFQKLEYDKMSDDERMSVTRHLYEKMSTHLTPDATEVGYDFWGDYKDTDEIKPVDRFVAHADDTLSQVKKAKNPSKEVWLNKEYGIIPQMKREWKSLVEPFKNERTLRDKIKKKASDLFNLPENQGKELTVDVAAEMEKAMKNIDETVYQPVRQKIDKIEEEVKKKAK